MPPSWCQTGRSRLPLTLASAPLPATADLLVPRNPPSLLVCPPGVHLSARRDHKGDYVRHYVYTGDTQRVPRRLPSRRSEVLDFIRGQVDAGKSFPSSAAIAQHMGWTLSGVSDCLHAIAAHGSIRRAGYTAGSPRKIIWELVA